MAIFYNIGACEVLPHHPGESHVHFDKLMGKSITFLSFKLVRKLSAGTQKLRLLSASSLSVYILSVMLSQDPACEKNIHAREGSRGKKRGYIFGKNVYKLF